MAYQCTRRTTSATGLSARSRESSIGRSSSSSAWLQHCCPFPPSPNFPCTFVFSLDTHMTCSIASTASCLHLLPSCWISVECQVRLACGAKVLLVSHRKTGLSTSRTVTSGAWFGPSGRKATLQIGHVGFVTRSCESRWVFPSSAAFLTLGSSELCAVPVEHLPFHCAPVMLSRTFSSSKTAAANRQVPRMRGPGGLGTGHSLLLRSQGEAGRARGKKEGKGAS